MTEATRRAVQNLALEIEWRELAIRHLSTVVEGKWDSLTGAKQPTLSFKAAAEAIPDSRLRVFAQELLTRFQSELEAMELPTEPLTKEGGQSA